MAISIDPNEKAHYEPSNQDLHCLQNIVLEHTTERIKPCWRLTVDVSGLLILHYENTPIQIY